MPSYCDHPTPKSINLKACHNYIKTPKPNVLLMHRSQPSTPTSQPSNPTSHPPPLFTFFTDYNPPPLQSLFIPKAYKTKQPITPPISSICQDTHLLLRSQSRPYKRRCQITWGRTIQSTIGHISHRNLYHLSLAFGILEVYKESRGYMNTKAIHMQVALPD